VCGKDDTHLQARICGIKSIGFGLAHLAEGNSTFDIVARVDVDEWNGKTEPQIFITDIAEALIPTQEPVFPPLQIHQQ
jgi:hypothetical protein